MTFKKGQVVQIKSGHFQSEYAVVHQYFSTVFPVVGVYLGVTESLRWFPEIALDPVVILNPTREEDMLRFSSLTPSTNSWELWGHIMERLLPR